MAKVTEQKGKNNRKKNSKLKRQIRKTAGAMFMISAIVIAAIPVQDVSAEDLKVDDTTNYADTRTANVNYAYPAGLTSAEADYITMSSASFLGENASPSNKTYYVDKLTSGEWSYNWQFGYESETVESQPKSIICTYNDTYPKDTVTIPNNAPSEYQTVTTTAYNTYYTTGLGGTTTYEVDYNTYMEDKLSPNVSMQMLAKYCPDEYNTKVTAFDAYTQYKDWLARHTQWTTDKATYDAWILGGQVGVAPPDPGAEPAKPDPYQDTEPAKISKHPSEFSDDTRLTYYCDFNTADDGNSLEGYKLVLVNDNVTPPSNPSVQEKIYLVQTIDGSTGAKTDPNGFYVVNFCAEIIGIAEKTFANINNVQTMVLMQELKYIGDGAFEGSFIKGITLANVTELGNFAFRDCTQLSSITMAGTETIGAEAFKGCNKLTSVAFPYNLKTVGYGAFAMCDLLNTVDFSAVNGDCDVKPYAFYNDIALNQVNMQTSSVTSLGEGAFSLLSAPVGGWTEAVLPDKITGSGTSILGDLLFAGRTNLRKVKFPVNYGTNNPTVIPSSMFKKCMNLEEVDFNAGRGNYYNGYVSFAYNGSNYVYNDLFRDVSNQNFCIKGPEKASDNTKAYPRQSTWQAFTTVANYVPYIYYDTTGKECYEISDGKYILQANENKQLTSCELIDPSQMIDLIIPDHVGEHQVETIAPGCFDSLKNNIKSITIEDNSLIGLDDSVFSNCPYLEWVVIGNSVRNVGSNAFNNCPKLVEVTFHTPSVGYDAFTVGTDAFKTNSNKLTFRGDIVKGYAPFDFAVGKDTGLIDDAGKRICYKSLPPDSLTVMYDADSDQVTLLGYPRYNSLDTLYAKHNTDMEKYYYVKYGSSNAAYDDLRDDFLAEYNSNPTAAYASDFYGPWIDTDFSTAHSGVTPYYSMAGNEYSIINNFEMGSNTRPEYLTPTDEEMRWINASLNIVVPAGVTSIDGENFFNTTANTRNVVTYFDDTTSDDYISREMCTNNAGDVTPGLFSGYYEDLGYTTDDPTRADEKYIKGNDRILSIVMNDVKELPDYCFDSCEKLQSVTIGEKLDTMGTAPFRGCYELATVSENDYFKPQNQIIYTVKPDGTYSIKECIPSRGITTSPIITSSTDSNLLNVSEIERGAFEDCDKVVKVLMEDATNLTEVAEDCFNDCNMLNEVSLPNSVKKISSNAFGGNNAIEVTIPGSEVQIDNDAFEHVSTNTIRTYKDSAADRYGKQFGITVEYLSDLFTVRFLDHDGTVLKEEKNIVAHQSATPPDDPTRTDYEFTGWSGSYNDVTENRTLIAQYSPNSSNLHTVTFYSYDSSTVVSEQKVANGGSAVAPIPPTRSGYTFISWQPATYTNVTKDMDIVATYEKGTSGSPGSSTSSSASPSPSPTSSTSGSSDSTKKYTVSVSGGSGSGSYAAGAVVAINAYDMGTGKRFDKWTTSTAGVGFANAESAATTFTMPANNVAITATYKAGGGVSSSAAGGTVGGSGTGNDIQSTGGSGTSVEITKPGISNEELAGATVSGTTDNFVIKVTEDATAEALAKQALQAEYGDISKIKYSAVDISLYDSTGRNKITDTSGIGVNLTIPLPDDLAQYAGNSRVASVLNGTLEEVDKRFTTVEGRACLNFTPPHLSPYVIYVDTANLVEGTIDATPKTGDPIHPKWFLSIGLACVAMILFFKRDKALISSKIA